MARTTLHAYLARLIWLCVLPLILLAAYLATASVRATLADRDLEAGNLAKNFATAIDQNLNARIRALQVLAASPLADDPSRRSELYREAQAFRESFGSHVILASAEGRMLFNTRAPFGTPLPPLPVPKGRAAAPVALETKEPAVGDVFFGPLAKEPLVAIAVPGVREGKASFLLLTVLETRLYQDRLEQLALPPSWSLSLRDGTGEAIARRAPSGMNPATDVDEAGRFAARSAVSPWSVVLEIPRGVYREPLLSAAAALVLAVLGATLAGVLGGTLAGRRLSRSVASLVGSPAQGPEIEEIAMARRVLEEATRKREAAESALRQKAEELSRLNAELETRVAQRTAELEATNAELESFSYSVSHDLRVPLRAVDGFSHLLQDHCGERLDAEGKRLIGVIRDGSRRMGQLIDDILAFSRMGRKAMATEDIDMAGLAKAAAAELAPAHADRIVELKIGKLPRALGDAAMLRQVWVNLLANALKFTRARASARIEVGADVRDGEHVYWVKDDGAGFDMRYAHKLFGVFQRLHGVDEFEGTGIGLAIVKRIVTRHGGRAWAEGKPNQGATVYFALPAGAAAQARASCALEASP
ncbi:MAG: ATP-binding protein [Pseudomonadota bacterium]